MGWERGDERATQWPVEAKNPSFGFPMMVAMTPFDDLLHSQVVACDRQHSGSSARMRRSAWSALSTKLRSLSTK